MLNPKDVSDDVRRLNPDLFRQVGEPQPQPKSSHLEDKFLRIWQEVTDRELEREYKFHPERRWRFDFAHEYTHIGIEIEGGIWSEGRHTRGRGFELDAIKYNEAAMRGWTVFRLTPSMITQQYVRRIAAYVSQEAE